MNTLQQWEQLYAEVNGRTFVGMAGIRDPEPGHECEGFDALGYNGYGKCMSDGHYLCTDCSQLSPEASRFVEHGRDGRRDRLILFFASLKRRYE